MKNDYFRFILENSNDIVSILNNKYEHQYVNQAHFKIVGYSKEKLVGKNIRDFIHPDDIERIRASSPKLINL